MTKQILILVCAAAVCLPLILVGCDSGSVEKVELAKLKVELEKLKVAYQKMSSERDGLKVELAAMTKSRDKLQQKVTGLSGGERKLRDQEEKKLRDQIEGLTGSNQSLSEKVTALTGSVDQLSGQLKKVTDSRDQLQKEIVELKTSRAALQAQVQKLTKQRDEAITNAQRARRELVLLAAKPPAPTETSREMHEGSVVESESKPKDESPASPTVHSFAASRTKINKGLSTTLSWHVSNADRIGIEPDIGSVSALGSTNVKPDKTKTYTLTATNSEGQTVESLTIQVR